MKLVYIAGPYTHPDPVQNTHEAIVEAEEIERLGVAVHIPHLSLLWHIVRPASIDRWYARDLAVLEHCDAVVRLPGPSVGADREVAHATELGLPVFYRDADMGRFVYWINDKPYPGAA